MVQVTDHPRTLEALHFACALACRKNSRVVLVKMVPVPHIGLLGTELGYLNFTGSDAEEISGYQTIAEAYGVEVEICLFQYVSLVEAIEEVADQLAAHVIFAALPHSPLPYGDRFQAWRLRHHFERHHCQLYLLAHEGKHAHWTPSILVSAAHQ